MANFRDTKGRQLDWISSRIEDNFSNFIHVDRHFNSSPILRRIFSLARKLNFQSLVIEEIVESECALLAEENEALRIRLSGYKSSRVRRLLFLKSLVGQPLGEKDLLGYAIFKEDFIGDGAAPAFHVYESVIQPPRDSQQNNYIHCTRTYQLNTSIGKLQVSGVLYAQQNDATFVCAHVGLRTVLASVLPEGDISYCRINQIAGIDHKNSKVGEGGKGLDPDQMAAVLKAYHLDFSKIIHEPTQGLALPGDFQRDLYGAIESGQPALLGFELSGNVSGRHIIPVIGHTFNEDTWVASASRDYFDEGLKYYPSENWLSTYAVHDDNCGPYFCLPRHYLKKDNFRIILSLKRHPTETEPVEAEAIALAYLNALANAINDNGEWMKRFKTYARHGFLVLRALHVTKQEYLNHIRQARCWNGNVTADASVSEIEATLPDYFWMIEASAPELFSASRRKFGEILIRSDLEFPKPLDFSLIILARLPGQILTLESKLLNTRPAGTDSHVELFSYLREER